MYTITTGQSLNITLSLGQEATEVYANFPPNKGIYARFTITPNGVTVQDTGMALANGDQSYSPGVHSLRLVAAPAGVNQATVTVKVVSPNNADMLAPDAEAYWEDEGAEAEEEVLD